MIKPINDDATPEAAGLLKYLYSLKDGAILTGQHNYIGENSLYSRQIAELTGKMPLIWGCDFGFSDGDDKDSILFREDLFREIIRRHKSGHIIVLSYHQGNPAIGEPCPFKGGVQSPFSSGQWEEMLTEGTELHKKWREMMDVLATFLKRVEAEAVPLVFRPYHEMNGGWFWWGARPEYFIRLWKMTYGYFTERHGINNLLWAWCSDKPWEGVEKYYPGQEYADILGSDIYPEEGKDEVYPQVYYNRMKALAGYRIVALTENSVIPDESILKTQPWKWFMGWSELTAKANSPEELKRLYANSRYISLEDRIDQ